MSDGSWPQKVAALVEHCDGSREKAGRVIGATMAEMYSYGNGVVPPLSAQQAIDRALAKVPAATVAMPKEVSVAHTNGTNGKVFAAKDCTDCGKSYVPSGAAQKRCGRCRGNGAATITTKPVTKRAVVPRPERRPSVPKAPDMPSGKIGFRELASLSLRASELFANIARDSAALLEILG